MEKLSKKVKQLFCKHKNIEYRKKFATICVVIMVIFVTGCSQTPVNTDGATDSAEITEGVCGADLTWKFEDGVLTISGTGDMTDFEKADETPWTELTHKIGYICIEEGCTHIGVYAFCPSGHESIALSVTMPDTVKSIGRHAFFNNSNLQKVDMPKNLEYIGEAAFLACKKLRKVKIPDSVTYMGPDAFANTAIKSIAIPDNIETFGDQCFSSDVMVAWRGNMYTGCDVSQEPDETDDELIIRMKEAGVAIEE